MTYYVNYSEPTTAKPALRVEDKSVNMQTSLGFVGQNYSGYAPILAENFLHLLENFAKSTPPENPVEGQIWYDNTTDDALLKVYDGSNWVPTGSITRTIAEPVATSSTNGDLWVNPTTQQLYIFSGTSWSLIGPQFSSGVKTGPVIDAVSDTLADINDTAAHNIISFYSNNERIAVLSADSFTPKAGIIGFTQINRGITLTSNTVSGETAKLVGTATVADGLNINSTVVTASNFLRSDVESTTNKLFQVKSNDGISIGGDLSFNIGISNSTITQTSLNKNIQVNFKDTSNVISTVLHIDTRKRVGIKNTNPAVELDVTGAAAISSNLVVGLVSDTTPGRITANGGITAAKVSTFNGELRSTSVITVSTPLGSNSTVALPVMLPTITDTFDIGSTDLKFKNIFATTLNGDLTGSLSGDVDGNVSGSAGYLKSAASIQMTGDMTSDAVSYDGKNNIQIKTTLSSGFITDKTVTTDSFSTDLLLVFRNTNNTSSPPQLRSISKSSFIASIPGVPVGTILPFAGKVNKVPKGYLLCDGSEVSAGTYSALFSVIDYFYRPTENLVGANTFALPDLRGRFPLGADGMDNTSLPKVTAKGSNDLIDARGKRNGTSLTIDQTDHANRVHNVNANTIGAGSGNENIEAPAIANTLGVNVDTSTGQRYSIMNPYLTINYIIFTGVL